MSYSDLDEALGELCSDQVKIEIGSGSSNHKITLSVCDDGLSTVLRYLTEELGWEDDTLMELIPALKDLKVTDLLTTLLSGGDRDEILEDLLSQLKRKVATVSSSSNASKDSILRNPVAGDTITHTREVVSVYGYGDGRRVTYRDEHGHQATVALASWRGYGANRKVARKG